MYRSILAESEVVRMEIRPHMADIGVEQPFPPIGFAAVEDSLDKGIDAVSTKETSIAFQR